MTDTHKPVVSDAEVDAVELGVGYQLVRNERSKLKSALSAFLLARLPAAVIDKGPHTRSAGWNDYRDAVLRRKT